MYQVCFAVFCALAIIQSVLSIGTRVYYAHKVVDSIQRHTSSASIRVNPGLAEYDGVELGGDAIGEKPEGSEEVDNALDKVGEWQSALNWELRKVDREIKGYALHIVGLLLEGACGATALLGLASFTQRYCRFANDDSGWFNRREGENRP